LDAMGAGLCFKKIRDLEQAQKAAEVELSSSASDAQAHAQTNRIIAHIADLRSQREAVANYENFASQTDFERESDRQDELELKQAIVNEQHKIANLELQGRQCENAFSLIRVEDDLCIKGTAQLLDKLMSLANRERELQIALRVKPDPPVTRKELLAAATSGNLRKRAKGGTGTRMSGYSRGNEKPRDNFRRCASFESTLKYDKPSPDFRRCASLERIPKYEERIDHMRVPATSPTMSTNGMDASSQNRNLVNKYRRNGSVGSDAMYSNSMDERRGSGQGYGERREARLPVVPALKPLPPSAPSTDNFHNSFKLLHVSTPPATPRNLVKAISPPSSTRGFNRESRVVNNWNAQSSFGNALPLLLESGRLEQGKQGDDCVCWGKPTQFTRTMDPTDYGGDEIAYYGFTN